MATFTFTSCDTLYLCPQAGNKIQLFGTFPLNTPIQVYINYTVSGTVGTTNGSQTLTGVPTGTAIGQVVSGTGIPTGATVTALSGTGATINLAATTTGSPTLTFTANLPCYSGVPGQGNTLYAIQAGLVVAFTPILPSHLLQLTANLYIVCGANTYLSSGQFYVRPDEFFSSVYALRAILPPNWAVGPRNITAENPAL